MSLPIPTDADSKRFCKQTVSMLSWAFVADTLSQSLFCPVCYFQPMVVIAHMQTHMHCSGPGRIHNWRLKLSYGLAEAAKADSVENPRQVQMFLHRSLRGRLNKRAEYTAEYRTLLRDLKVYHNLGCKVQQISCLWDVRNIFIVMHCLRIHMLRLP